METTMPETKLKPIEGNWFSASHLDARGKLVQLLTSGCKRETLGSCTVVCPEADEDRRGHLEA